MLVARRHSCLNW